MKKFNKDILTINSNICRNISKFDDSERGMLSQNILSQLRNFVELIAIKIYSTEVDNNIKYDYLNIQKSLNHIKKKGNYKFLNDFHDLLQISASHYTLDENSSERLMLKYYEYLLKIKVFLEQLFDIKVLENIDDFPLNTDLKFTEYYEKIAEKINILEANADRHLYTSRYYIQKVKPFFINHNIYYEVTFTQANDKTSKFDRIIAFTKLDISTNYAVNLSLSSDYIEIMDRKMPIQIIQDWEVSIRPCELENFSAFFGEKIKINSSGKGYKLLMKFLTESKMNLNDLIELSEDDYLHTKDSFIKDSKGLVPFLEILDKCRDLVNKKSPGSVIIKYLLLRLNNKILKYQYCTNNCNILSNLKLKFGCAPFDQMPFNSSLINHNPKLSDLFSCIKPDTREHELFARFIKYNTEINGILFTPISEIKDFNNIDQLINEYNRNVYYKHQSRKLAIYKNHVYIKGYVEDAVEIINKLRELSSNGVDNYSNSVEYWLQNTPYYIDCPDKKKSLKQMFEKSHVAIIYGAAGTGKSTLINHISNFFNDKRKLYLANTNPAIENLKRKVNAANCTFKTIASFLSTSNYDTSYNILIIDESSTVSNSDMKSILKKANYSILILAGDVFQIESIRFGNWFNIVKSFIPSESIFELEIPYRTTNEELLNVWKRVRNNDKAILEPLVKNKYSAILDDSIFEHSEDDEIILTLNYDGLYGINNLNTFLQANNKNLPVQLGANIYKIGDPILFNESQRFMPLIYNNLKGKILDIKELDLKVQFIIEIDKVINQLDAEEYGLEFIRVSENGNSIISFFVNKYRNTDEDDNDLSSEAIVPFQVSYAVSIHKAQGLEYNSVKIVITDEIDELITHNIFYTAITRTKNNLKIYWTPETENKILNNFCLKNNNKDINLLRSKYNL